MAHCIVLLWLKYLQKPLAVHILIICTELHVFVAERNAVESTIVLLAVLFISGVLGYFGAGDLIEIGLFVYPAHLKG